MELHADIATKEYVEEGRIKRFMRGCKGIGRAELYDESCATGILVRDG